MGFTGEVVTDGRAWLPEGAPSGAPWLKVDVFDSDIGALEYWPHLGGSGVAFAGVSPATYYEDDSIPPTDKAREIAALSAWFNLVGIPISIDTLNDVIVDDGEMSEEPFVEVTLRNFFAATKLGAPPSL